MSRMLKRAPANHRATARVADRVPAGTTAGTVAKAAAAVGAILGAMLMCGVMSGATYAATGEISQATPSSGAPKSVPSAAPTFAYHSDLRPVHAVSATMISVDGGLLPVYTSADMTMVQPQIVRAIIVIHGKLRNADSYFATIRHAELLAADDAANTTLIVAPQFLATLDIAPNHVSDNVLRWQDNAWMAGEAAVGPAPVSSYRALDTLVSQLANRHRFPHLREIVIAGHSGGAQVAQRYAVASHNGDVLAQSGIRVRFLLSSPSTYAYFDTQRPVVSGQNDKEGEVVKGGDGGAHITFAVYDASACPAFDQWKYGMQTRPAYLAADDPKKLEIAYVVRDVTYLVGGDDDSPTQKAMDKSCPAEAQGSERVIRAQAYYAYLLRRHGSLPHQTFHVVPEVGHNQAKMLTSICALHVMFGKPGCGTE